MARMMITINERLLMEAQRLSGAKTKKATIELALQELVRRLRRRDLKRHAGTIELELTQEDLRRLREER